MPAMEWEADMGKVDDLILKEYKADAMFKQKHNDVVWQYCNNYNCFRDMKPE